MIKKIALAACLIAAHPALAADPEDPVRSIMDLATALWSDKGAEGQDYFDNAHVNLFSKSFIAAYKEAAKFPIYDEAGGPFGYDVITSSQDGCPLKELTITNQGEKAGITDIKVTFKLNTCFDDDPANKEKVTEVHFEVVMEDSKPVIADLHRIDEDGKTDSLMQEMADIAKNGKESGSAPQ